MTSEWCSYCGARAVKDGLCGGECAEQAKRDDYYESTGRSLEPSARAPGGNFGPISETTDYRRDEE